MTIKETKAHQTWRRGELMAELFLQDLNPEFVAQPTAEDFAFDYLIGFANKEGGVNTYAVEVEATEKPVNGAYSVPRELFNRLTHSNIPLILLVVDVKQNSLFYAWPIEDENIKANVKKVSVPLTLVDDESRNALRAQMAG